MEKEKKNISTAKIVICLCLVFAVAITILLVFLNKSDSDYGEYIRTDYSENFEFVGEQTPKEDVIEFTPSTCVNNLISSIVLEKGFTQVEVLEYWHDVALDVDSYYVLFDEQYLYYFMDNKGVAYANEHDYEYYLEMSE